MSCFFSRKETELPTSTAGHSRFLPAISCFSIPAKSTPSLPLPAFPLTFYAVVFGLDLISSYGNDDIQQKYIHRQTSGELLFQTVFHPKSPGTEPLRQSLEAIRSLYQEDFSSHELLIKGGTSPDLALSLPLLPRHKPSSV